MAEKKTETTPAGDHTFSSEWSNDAVNHWHSATCGHDLIKDKSKHTWNENNECEVCHYKMQYTQGLEYKKYSTSASVKSLGSATSNDIVIPAYIEIDGKTLPVTSVNSEVFRKSKITSVIFSNNMKTIGKAAFMECKNLKTVVFPDTLKEIDTSAFSDCISLENFTLPSNVLALRSWCFKDCDSITSVTIPAKTQYITSAFLGCDLLQTVVFEKGKDLNKPDFSGAFYGCSALENVTIPENIDTISEQAFADCTSLKSINLHDQITTIKEDAFEGCTGLVTFSIPASTTIIETNAFNECNNLLEIYNKSSLNIVAGEETNGKIALNAINIYSPTSGSSIMASDKDGFVFGKGKSGWELFCYVGTATEITIPSTFTNKAGETISSYTIRNNAFNDCKQLIAINVLDDNAKYSSLDGVLYNKTATELVRVPVGKTGSYVMPNSIKAMVDNSFYNCKELTSVTFGDGIRNVTNIDCFKNCYNLTTVTLGSKITEFNESIFDYTEALTTINVDESNSMYSSVDGILYNKNITKLIYLPYSREGNIVIPDGVTSLGTLGLRQARITSVTLPASITDIGYGFYQCNWLEEVIFKGTIEQWNAVRKTSVNGENTWADGIWLNDDGIKCSDGIAKLTSW